MSSVRPRRARSSRNAAARGWIGASRHVLPVLRDQVQFPRSVPRARRRGARPRAPGRDSVRSRAVQGRCSPRQGRDRPHPRRTRTAAPEVEGVLGERRLGRCQAREPDDGGPAAREREQAGAHLLVRASEQIVTSSSLIASMSDRSPAPRRRAHCGSRSSPDGLASRSAPAPATVG